jgi:chlorophyll synthase/bacteriochlorophyll c synthase
LAALTFGWGHSYVAIFIVIGVVVPIYHQIRLYQEPNHRNFLRYIIASNPFVASIHILSALVVGNFFG